MEDLLEWLEKRVQKLKDKKKTEEGKDNPDMEEVKRLGAKIAGYKEVVRYIQSHK